MLRKPRYTTRRADDVKSMRDEVMRIEKVLEEQKDWLRGLADRSRSREYQNARRDALDSIQQTIEAVNEMRRQLWQDMDN